VISWTIVKGTLKSLIFGSRLSQARPVQAATIDRREFLNYVIVKQESPSHAPSETSDCPKDRIPSALRNSAGARSHLRKKKYKLPPDTLASSSLFQRFPSLPKFKIIHTKALPACEWWFPPSVYQPSTSQTFPSRLIHPSANHRTSRTPKQISPALDMCDMTETAKVTGTILGAVPIECPVCGTAGVSGATCPGCGNGRRMYISLFRNLTNLTGRWSELPTLQALKPHYWTSKKKIQQKMKGGCVSCVFMLVFHRQRWGWQSGVLEWIVILVFFSFLYHAMQYGCLAWRSYSPNLLRRYKISE